MLRLQPTYMTVHIYLINSKKIMFNGHKRLNFLNGIILVHLPSLKLSIINLEYIKVEFEVDQPTEYGAPFGLRMHRLV